MALSKLWTNFSVQLSALTAQSGAIVYLDAIVDLMLNSQLATQLEAGDGNIFATFGSLVKGGPVARFTTLDLAVALGQLGVTSMLVDSNGGTRPGIVLYFRRMSSGGTRDGVSAGTHISATIANGIAVPRRISCRSGENARLDCEVIATQSGATAPVAYSTTANLSANTTGATQVWTIGPVELAGSLGGTVLDGLESVEVDFGVRVFAESRDSDVYPSFASVADQRPEIRLKGVHIDQINTLTADGAYYTNNVVVYFKRRTEGGSFVANATAQHIKLSIAKARAEVMGFSGDPKTVDLKITPWQDTAGPTNPLVVSTASAIT